MRKTRPTRIIRIQNLLTLNVIITFLVFVINFSIIRIITVKLF